MSDRLSGKTALITGGTTGLGLATAKRYIEEGAEVIITGRTQDGVDRATADLGDHARGLAADSTSLPDLDRVAEAVKGAFGKLDILLVNAGNGMFAPVSDVDEALYDSQFDLNVKGVFFTVQKLLPLLVEGSSIILTSSSVHSKGAPGGSLYFASKAAVRSFARTMAAELGGKGIRVNSLSPGIVPTQFFKNSNAPKSSTVILNNWPERARRSAALASPKRSRRSRCSLARMRRASSPLPTISSMAAG